MEQDEQISKRLVELNELIKPYQLAWVSPSDECELLRRNARSMSKEMQNRLNENVKNDGFLSQLPFCILMASGKYKVISGNHRVVAAIKAGLKKILVMFVRDEDMSKDQQLAIQLSHNSISGEDDAQILKEIFDEITDIASKAYSGVDQKQFIDMSLKEIATISADDIEINEISFCFADVAEENVKECLAELEKRGISEKDGSIIVGTPDNFIKTMTAIKKVKDIKNHSVAFYTMCVICKEWLSEHTEEELKEASNRQEGIK